MDKDLAIAADILYKTIEAAQKGDIDFFEKIGKLANVAPLVLFNSIKHFYYMDTSKKAFVILSLLVGLTAVEVASHKYYKDTEMSDIYLETTLSVLTDNIEIIRSSSKIEAKKRVIELIHSITSGMGGGYIRESIIDDWATLMAQNYVSESLRRKTIHELYSLYNSTDNEKIRDLVYILTINIRLKTAPSTINLDSNDWRLSKQRERGQIDLNWL